MISGALTVAILAALAATLVVWVPGSERENVLMWARVAQATATGAAVALGGIFAWRRGIIFRDEQPHVTIRHHVTHRRVSPSYAHIEITAILQNTSRVKVEICDGLFTVQQIAPVSDLAVENLYTQTFTNQQNNGALQWESLNEIPLSWNKDELIAEPGETVETTFEYIVPDFVESVLITTFFYNLQAMGKISASVQPRDAEKKEAVPGMAFIRAERLE